MIEHQGHMVRVWAHLGEPNSCYCEDCKEWLQGREMPLNE